MAPISLLPLGHRQGQFHVGRRRTEKIDGMDGVDGGEHLGGQQDFLKAQHGQHGEPDEHDRPENLADAGRAPSLDGKKPKKAGIPASSILSLINLARAVAITASSNPLVRS